MLSFLVGGKERPILPYNELKILPFKSKITNYLWRTARNYACAFGELSSAPVEKKRVVKYTLDAITSCTEFCLDPIRSQLYSFGTKDLVNSGTGVVTTIPRVMRTTSIQESYQVRYIY